MLDDLADRTETHTDYRRLRRFRGHFCHIWLRIRAFRFVLLTLLLLGSARTGAAITDGNLIQSVAKIIIKRRRSPRDWPPL